MIMPLAQVSYSEYVISRSEATRDLVLWARFLLTSFVEMTVMGVFAYNLS